jgi:hypothetical protein
MALKRENKAKLDLEKATTTEDKYEAQTAINKARSEKQEA